MVVDEKWAAVGKAHDLLALDGLEYREYQASILRSIFSAGNSLVILPTGLGKTLIGAGVCARSMAMGKKALFLAPTKPLVEQHYASLSALIRHGEGEVAMLIGSVGKEERGRVQGMARVIIATPQTVANELRKGTMSLDSFGSVVFDECHRAVGRYAYTYIANECKLRGILTVGLTASPGSDRKRINALVDALGIHNIEIRSSSDPDVARYVMPKYVHISEVETGPTVNMIASLLKPEMDKGVTTLNKFGLARFKFFFGIPKGRIIAIGREIESLKEKNYRYAAAAAYVKLLNTSHAYDLITTEGIYPFHSYLESLYMKEEKSRSLEALLKEANIIKAREVAADAVKRGEEHPKVIRLISILKDCRGKRSIVFAQYRSTIKMLVDFLSNNDFRAMAFVGKKQGVTQFDQKEIVDGFRAGKFDVLVASSIGEEGLDIPSVDNVIFYEPIPNEIRNIQRRGRAGRISAGNIYIIAARGTKDQIYLRVSERKELKMADIVRRVAVELKEKNARSAAPGQARL